MPSIRGIYEVAIRVKDLARSEAFYREVLGLEPALRDDHRHWVFLWVGGKAGVVVLQQDPPRAVAGPVVHEWMQGKSLCFADPDGHDLELCGPIGRKRGASS
ncbi:MAG TPA: VOC family protein [Candidatus Binatia bacterium]|nr:VOC family protein [Candidatus Binatia bacterium]